MPSLAEHLIRWHPLNGRHDLPWQQRRDPYAIWISEIMLQQTQVSTVIPYYQRFMQTFPAVDSLANAPLDAVLALWSGLGYYSRARNLHLAAQRIMQEHQGQFPESRERIQQLPGIGRSTAAAIAVFAFGQREAILDGNVKRILARFFGIDGYPGQPKIQKLLWQQAEAALTCRSSWRPHRNLYASSDGFGFHHLHPQQAAMRPVSVATAMHRLAATTCRATTCCKTTQTITTKRNRITAATASTAVIA
jgi:A/G-specific adenine glycosylase